MTETEVGYGIVGAGRLGRAISRRLAGAGVAPGVIYSSSRERAQALAKELGWRVAPSAGAVLAEAEVSLLCVPDPALGPLVDELSSGPPLPGRVVAHCAGSRGPEPLFPLRQRQCGVGVFHPLAPIPDGDPSSLEGTYVAIEAEPPVLARLRALAGELGCQVLEVGGLDRPLYHAAAVFAGVMPVVLERLGERLGEASGGGPELGEALRALYLASGRNVQRLGPERGMSGPLQRRDASTVTAHLAALSRFDPELARLYQLMLEAARTVPAPQPPKEAQGA
ncbi:MAG TPA: DUF2520 domain-containing protein [Candidatus Dormibacteraeota bacterium]